MRFHAKNVSVAESCDEYFEIPFDCESPGVDDFDPSVHASPYLVVQRQFEDDDGGVCYMETHTPSASMTCSASCTSFLACKAEADPGACPLLLADTGRSAPASGYISVQHRAAA